MTTVVCLSFIFRSFIKIGCFAIDKARKGCILGVWIVKIMRFGSYAKLLC